MNEIVDYKGFSIKVEKTALYWWDNEHNMCQETQVRAAYKIIDLNSGLTCGVKQSLASAQKAIDVNGKRWKIRTA